MVAPLAFDSWGSASMFVCVVIAADVIMRGLDRVVARL
jgi:hypothetical protein